MRLKQQLNNRDQIPKFKIRPKVSNDDIQDELLLLSPPTERIESIPVLDSGRSSLLATAKFGGELGGENIKILQSPSPIAHTTQKTAKFGSSLSH